MMVQGLFLIILYTYFLMLSVTKEPRQLLFRQPPGLRENITNTFSSDIIFFFWYYLFLLRFVICFNVYFSLSWMISSFQLLQSVFILLIFSICKFFFIGIIRLLQSVIFLTIRYNLLIVILCQVAWNSHIWWPTTRSSSRCWLRDIILSIRCTDNDRNLLTSAYLIF